MHELLKQHLAKAAASLHLPIAFEGEVFCPPVTAHVRVKIQYSISQAASVGTNGLTRVDGLIELTIVGPAGTGDSQVMALGESLSKAFPRGDGLKTANTDLVFMTSNLSLQTPGPDRARALLNVPFYMLIF